MTTFKIMIVKKKFLVEKYELRSLISSPRRLFSVMNLAFAYEKRMNLESLSGGELIKNSKKIT